MTTVPHPLLDSFDGIRIINLAARHDRRRAVTRELRRLGVVVDGARVRFHTATRPDGPADFPSTGARGCFLSHLQVLRDARAEGVKRLLVLEDDVMFGTAMGRTRRLSEALQDVRWHLAYPGHPLAARPGPLRWLVTEEPLVCAHCYAVHEHAMDTVIAHLEACLTRPVGHALGSPMHYDGALTLLRRQHPELITLLASSSLAGQRSSRSDIIGPSWLDRLPVARLLRAVKNSARRLTDAL